MCPPPVPKRRKLPLSIPLLIALVSGAAALGVKLSFYSSHSVNGVVEQCTSINVAPLLFGPVAAVMGIVAMILCRRPGRKTLLELGLGLACVAMCVVAIAFRVTGGACPS